jgi:4-amino-4-deoxy-L-arabinose transferase-like glycosyltransferase
MFVDAGQNGPLYFLLLRPWFWLVGTSETALRLPSAAAGVVAVLLTFQVAKRLLPVWTHRPAASDPPTASAFRASGGRAVAWLAAVFMAANPYQLWYGQEGKMYTVVTALVLLATWWWLEGITRGGWRPWLAYWATVTVALYTHLLLILLFPLHLLWFLLAWPVSRPHWRGYGGAMAGLTLPYLPMVWWQWALLTAQEQRTGFSFTPPLEMARTLLFNQSRGFMPPGDLVWMLPIFFLLAAALLLGMGELAPQRAGGMLVLAAWRRWALVVAWLITPALSIYALSLRQPIFTDRYIIWIAPALMMLIGLGLVVVRRYVGGVGQGVATALLVYVVAFWLFAGWQQKTLPTKYDLRGGVGYIAAHRAADALLILQIPHMEWAYRYYTSDFGPRPFDQSELRLDPWRAGLWTNQGWPDEVARADVAAHMIANTQGHTDVWVLRSEVEMWDRRYLMDEWLALHGDLIEQADFHGVQVRRYQLDPNLAR